MANQEHSFIVSILRAPGALMGTVASPAWEKKAYATGYNQTYGSLTAAQDFSMDNRTQEIFVLRKADKAGEDNFYEAISFVDIQDRIREGKIKKDDFVLLDAGQRNPERAGQALSGFEFDWKVEKTTTLEGTNLVEAITAAVVAAVAPAPAPAPALVAEMQHLMLQMQNALEMNKKLEKQVETLLAEKEVKKANPVK